MRGRNDVPPPFSFWLAVDAILDEVLRPCPLCQPVSRRRIQFYFHFAKSAVSDKAGDIGCVKATKHTYAKPSFHSTDRDQRARHLFTATGGRDDASCANDHPAPDCGLVRDCAVSRHSSRASGCSRACSQVRGGGVSIPRCRSHNLFAIRPSEPAVAADDRRICHVILFACLFR